MMRKQTKLVAVLSAAALLAVGASMTSFAAGWTEENGTWVYYNNDDELVTNEWKKSGSNYYYLDENGEMLTESWVDDEYYVDETGKMVTNTWLKLVPYEGEVNDPDSDGEAWYWFDSKGKRVSDMKKTINGKVYFFDSDGQMENGWFEDDDDIYYLGDEDDGARKSGWLWLEQPTEEDVSIEEDDCELCEEEGWYWFSKDGKLYRDATKAKKIDGKYYYFNEHGQMLYNWIATAAEAFIPDSMNEDYDDPTNTIDEMRYAFNVDKGNRVDGWLLLDGSYSVGKEDDEDWYFFKKGEAKYADENRDVISVLNSKGYNDFTDPRIRQREKVEGKYFCFDQNGAMKAGLQAITTDGADYDTYYFDENGFMKTGKVSNVELDNGDVATFYFTTSNINKGKGVTGEKDGYLYYKGMRLEAEDDYKIFQVDGDNYLVNTNGKIQKSTSGKKIDAGKIENWDPDINIAKANDDENEYVYVATTKNYVMKSIYVKDAIAGEDGKENKVLWTNDADNAGDEQGTIDAIIVVAEEELNGDEDLGLVDLGWCD